MKKTQNTRKFDAEAKLVLADILAEDISDKSLRLVSISGVDVAPDKSFMHVYVSCDNNRYEAVLKALDRAKGYIRHQLAERLGWRIVPNLDFSIDTSHDYAEKIEQLLKDKPPFMSEDEGDE